MPVTKKEMRENVNARVSTSLWARFKSATRKKKMTITEALPEALLLWIEAAK